MRTKLKMKDLLLLQLMIIEAATKAMTERASMSKIDNQEKDNNSRAIDDLFAINPNDNTRRSRRKTVYFL